MQAKKDHNNQIVEIMPIQMLIILKWEEGQVYNKTRVLLKNSKESMQSLKIHIIRKILSRLGLRRQLRILLFNKSHLKITTLTKTQAIRNLAKEDLNLILILLLLMILIKMNQNGLLTMTRIREKYTIIIVSQKKVNGINQKNSMVMT